MPYGDLDVYLEGALNIKDTSYIGKGSPYCILTVGQQIFKSDVAQEGGSKPYWNKTFSFKIDRGMDDLQIRIYNKNTLRDDDLLGESLISFAQVFRGGHQVPTTAYIVNRSRKHHGEVRLGFTFYAKRRAQPRAQAQPSANEHAQRRGGRQQHQQPSYYRSQGLGTDTDSPRYNGLNRNVSFKTTSDEEYASSNEGSGRRYSFSHGRNGSVVSRFSDATEGFVGAEDSQPADTVHEQQEDREGGPVRSRSLPPAAHHPNNQYRLQGSQSLPPHAVHAQYAQRPQFGHAKQRPVMRPHVEGPLWPPRGVQHEQSTCDDEEGRYDHEADGFKDLDVRSGSGGQGQEIHFPNPPQDRGVKSLSPDSAQDSSMSKRDGDGIHVAMPRLLTSFQDMGSRVDFSFAEVSSPSPKQGYSAGMSGANDGIPTAIELGKLTLVAHDEEEEFQVEEVATTYLAASTVTPKDEARPNNDGGAMGSVTPDDDGPLYKSFRHRGGQGAKKLPQVVESPRASQSSKLAGDSGDAESQSSQHSRKSNLSQRDRFIPHEQSAWDRDVDGESTHCVFGEDLSPNVFADQVPSRMGPRNLIATQGCITEGGPHHSQLPMCPPNVPSGAPNLGYGRGGIPQQENGGPLSTRPIGCGQWEATMIRPPLEHNNGIMGVGHQGFPPGNMQSAQGPRPQRQFVTNQQGFQPIRPRVQHHQRTDPMQMQMRTGDTRGAVGVEEGQDADSDVESCGSRKSKRSHVSRDSPRSTTSSGLARVGPPLPLKPNFAIKEASKKDGRGLGNYEFRVQAEVEEIGGELETSSTQPINFLQENNDAKSGSDPGHLEDKDTPALETLQDEGGASFDEESVQEQVSIPQEQSLDTEVESDVHFTMKETSVLDALDVAPSVTMQDLHFIDQNNRPNDDDNHNGDFDTDDAHVDFQETEDLKVSYDETFVPQGNVDDAANNEVGTVFLTQEDYYDGAPMATIECEVYAQVVDVDEQADHGFEFPTSALRNSESHAECQDPQAQKYVNGGCDDSDVDASSHDAKVQHHKTERRKKDEAISQSDYRDLSPPKYIPRRSSKVPNVHAHYAGAEQNDRVSSWLQESNGDDSVPPHNPYQDQQPRGRGRGRGQVDPRGRGLLPPSNIPQYDEQSYHPYYDLQPTGEQYYGEAVDEAVAYPQAQYNTQERGVTASVSRPAVVEKQVTDGKSTMAKKMKGVMKNLTSFGKATLPVLAPIGVAITGEVVKQTLALTADIGSGQGGAQGYDQHVANMIVNNATNMLVRAALAPQQQGPVGRGSGGAPMQGQAPMRGQIPMQAQAPMRGQIPMQAQAPMRGQTPMQAQAPMRPQLPSQGAMRGQMMPRGYGGPRPMMGQPRPQSMGGYAGAPQRGGYAGAPQRGGYAGAPQRGGYAGAPRVGGYAGSPQMGGYAGSPQMGGYAGSPQMGGQPRPPTYYQGEEY